jgi:hypothetical protein
VSRSSRRGECRQGPAQSGPGLAEFPTLSGSLFAGLGAGVFATSYAVQWLFIGQFGWTDAAKYSAFLQNLLMSGLFIAMLIARRGPQAAARPPEATAAAPVPAAR